MTMWPFILAALLTGIIVGVDIGLRAARRLYGRPRGRMVELDTPAARERIGRPW